VEDNTLQAELPTGYKASFKLAHSLRQQVTRYIERCHLEDGGYFFARVLPSSGLDTYFAVKSLSIMGVKPNNPEAIASFFLNDFKASTIVSMTGIFVSVEVLNELARLNDDLKSYAYQRIMPLQNKAGGFGALENIDVEVASELQETYRAVRILKIVNASFDKRRITDFVLGELNLDGGYGREGRSTLASTYYATEILKLLENDTSSVTRDYLRNREENWQVQFIEDLYWLIMGLGNLGEKFNFPERAIEFVMECQRANGGFSRATAMGIPTLEYTFYALSILKEVGAL
jgi:hypothetical protein